MTEDHIFDRIEQDLRVLLSQGLTDNESDLWSSRASVALSKFVTADRKVDRDAFRNFRRNQTFINELPGYGNSFRDWIAGSRRGEKVYLRERYDVMRQAGDADLLKTYPIKEVGNPYIFEHDGARFNKRWSNNLRYLSLARRHLKEKLSTTNCTAVDIGGGYGIFLQLLKYEFPASRPVLVEFPEQLLLAYYYLQSLFPAAKINRLEDAYQTGSIDRAFLERHDFTLIPIDCYEKIAAGSFDLVANFFSLGEMSEQWFDTYRNSGAFDEAPFLLTVNRLFSKPTYGTDIDVLRYRLHEYEPLHFEGSIYEKYHVTGHAKFFFKRVPYTSQFFEFVGCKKAGARSTKAMA